MTLEIQNASPEYARQLTDRIKIAIDGTWQLVVEAYQSRSWSALGYRTWDDYCTREFGNSRLRLPREERQEQVASLRESGLSLRAIESATRLSVNTIRNDLAQVYQNDTPEPRTASIQSGAAWLGSNEKIPVEAETEIDLDTGEVVSERSITGMDGKSYPRAEPAKPKRRPITDQARDAGWEMRRVTEKLQRILEDDRLSRNKEEVAAHIRGHLMFTVEACQGFLDQINN